MWVVTICLANQKIQNYWWCGEILSAMFARRKPLFPSFLSLVTITKVLRYFNDMLIYDALLPQNVFPQNVLTKEKESENQYKTKKALPLGTGLIR